MEKWIYPSIKTLECRPLSRNPTLCSLRPSNKFPCPAFENSPLTFVPGTTSLSRHAQSSCSVLLLASELLLHKILLDLSLQTVATRFLFALLSGSFLLLYSAPLHHGCGSSTRSLSGFPLIFFLCLTSLAGVLSAAEDSDLSRAEHTLVEHTLGSNSSMLPQS